MEDKKMESAEIIIKQGGDCSNPISIDCETCFYNDYTYTTCGTDNSRRLTLAKNWLKEQNKPTTLSQTKLAIYHEKEGYFGYTTAKKQGKQCFTHVLVDNVQLYDLHENAETMLSKLKDRVKNPELLKIIQVKHIIKPV